MITSYLQINLGTWGGILPIPTLLIYEQSAIVNATLKLISVSDCCQYIEMWLDFYIDLFSCNFDKFIVLVVSDKFQSIFFIKMIMLPMDKDSFISFLLWVLFIFLAWLHWLEPLMLNRRAESRHSCPVLNFKTGGRRWEMDDV